MLRYAGRRLATMIPALMVIIVLVFALLRMIPGDPAVFIGGENIGPDALQALRERLGLAAPLPQQFLDYVGSLATFDLGRSLHTQLPVTSIIGNAITLTASIAITSTVVGLLISVPLGVLAAYAKSKGRNRGDGALMAVVMVLDNVPSFWLSLLLMLGLSYGLGLFPISGAVSWSDPVTMAQRLALPIIVLAIGQVAALTRVTRSSVVETLGRDYVRTARAMGTPEPTILFRHALPNAALPIITMTGLSFGRLLAGTVIVEAIFSIPGIGTQLIQAITGRDYPVVQGLILVYALIFLTINVVTDVVYTRVDPRVRLA
ncbi:ABC transporter permease [Pseudactinotalea sp.]|uniref:ABC transporter permease n=1 Tax=Pseudactinotalea sp. TaxID=1926260 RepID=UPI003B3A2FE4